MNDQSQGKLPCDATSGSGDDVDPTLITAEHHALVARLRGLRRRASLTQAQLAALLDEDQTTISAIETGQRRVDVVELRTILLALGEPAAAVVAAYDAMTAVMGALGDQPSS